MVPPGLPDAEGGQLAARKAGQPAPPQIQVRGVGKLLPWLQVLLSAHQKIVTQHSGSVILDRIYTSYEPYSLFQYGMLCTYYLFW